MDNKDFAGDKAFLTRKSIPNIEEDLVQFNPADSDDLDVSENIRVLFLSVTS